MNHINHDKHMSSWFSSPLVEHVPLVYASKSVMADFKNGKTHGSWMDGPKYISIIRNNCVLLHF